MTKNGHTINLLAHFISDPYFVSSKERWREREAMGRRRVSITKKTQLDWNLMYQTPVLFEPFNPVFFKAYSADIEAHVTWYLHLFTTSNCMDKVIGRHPRSISLKDLDVMFGCWLPPLASLPTSLLPPFLPLAYSHASYCQLSALNGLVYGCELVFDRENWEVFRLIETASLFPLDSFQTYWSAFREEATSRALKQSRLQGSKSRHRQRWSALLCPAWRQCQRGYRRAELWSGVTVKI